jgi:histidinol dehydrogenase
MKTYDWNQLDEAARRDVLARPQTQERSGLQDSVRATVAAVRLRGDAAVREFTARFDGVEIDELRVDKREFARARAAVSIDHIRALERAIGNIRRFHEAQKLAPIVVETSPGVTCERIVRPIPSVGLYVPAGSAPLPSALIMAAVPALLAGCRQRILCSPPGNDGKVHPAILVAADLCEIDTVFRIGGAQAVAAMAYGTETVPKVDKIFGPGSAWVTAAKQIVAADAAGAALDLPAGPSEVLVVADATARADFVAADLLAQAEHDRLSQAILVTDHAPLAAAVVAEVARQMAARSRREILEESVASSRAIVVADLAEALDVSNRYAPEHLLLQVADARRWLAKVVHAGSVFLGHWTPEPMGDYCSGTNHVLPTYGYARAYSGLSLLDFSKRITVQELTAHGLRDLGPTAASLADLEGLDAHAEAVRLRLRELDRAGEDPGAATGMA